MPDVNPFAFESPSIPSSDTADAGAATLRITRPWHHQDMLRAYQISVDALPRGKIRNNETLTISVEPGELSVVATIDWAKTDPVFVTAQAGDVIDLEVSGNLSGVKILLAAYYAIFAPHQWLTLKRI